MLPRPRVRLPLWAVLPVVAIAYLGRAALRGFDFAPDIPMDAFVAGAIVAVTGLVAWLRADDARRDAEDVAAHDAETDELTPG